MTVVKVCVVEPSASFVTYINGSATVEDLQRAEKDLRENFESYAISTDVWEITASLNQEGGYFDIIKTTIRGEK